jgi:hypothetical protein
LAEQAVLTLLKVFPCEVAYLGVKLQLVPLEILPPASTSTTSSSHEAAHENLE